MAAERERDRERERKKEAETERERVRERGSTKGTDICFGLKSAHELCTRDLSHTHMPVATTQSTIYQFWYTGNCGICID